MPEHTSVVVGAAQGIGAAIARRLAAEPGLGRLVVADVRKDGIEELASELQGSGVKVDAVQTDITVESSVASLVGQCGDASRVALVAGIFQAKPSLEVTSEELNTILGVNLVGTFMVAQAFARSMLERSGGSICAVGSIAARMARMRQAAYCASKAGMRQALRVLAMEVLPLGVRINFVAPGPTASEMMTQLSRDHDQSELWRGSAESLRPPIPDGRVGTPEDVAEAVAFLLSGRSGHIALHDLYVDGGETLGI